jgi:hypothetical protein
MITKKNKLKQSYVFQITNICAMSLREKREFNISTIFRRSLQNKEKVILACCPPTRSHAVTGLQSGSFSNKFNI